MTNHRYPYQKAILARTEVTFFLKAKGEVYLYLVDEYSKKHMELELSRIVLDYYSLKLYFPRSGKYSYFFVVLTDEGMETIDDNGEPFELEVYEENYSFGKVIAIS